MSCPTFRNAGNLHKPAVGTSGRIALPVPLRPAPRVATTLRPCASLPSSSSSPTAAAAAAAGVSDPDSNVPRAYSIVEVVRLRKGLQQDLEAAIKAEDYGQAATIKKKLNELDATDPIANAKAALQKAIKDERYEDAAKITAQLKQLESELGAAALDSDLLTTSSDTVTRGVRVKVQSFFLPGQSDPRANRFMFAYRITISNEGSQIVQLRQRHWVIMDANGKVEEVRGPGVVGEQPILVPGKSFDYTSGCPLTTPQGSMEGEFTMVVLSEVDGEWKETMEVRIGKFKLDVAGPAAV